MKEYKGAAGGCVIVSGNELLIKQNFLSESCTFDDVISVEFAEPVAGGNGRLTIHTVESGKTPHCIFFKKKSAGEFSELYGLLTDRTPVANVEAKNPVAPPADAKMQNLELKSKKLKIKQQQQELKDLNNMARCPKCKSTSLSGQKKGFGVGKAVVGGMVAGPLGLVAGNIGARKVRVTCLNCGKQFKA